MYDPQHAPLCLMSQRFTSLRQACSVQTCSHHSFALPCRAPVAPHVSLLAMQELQDAGCTSAQHAMQGYALANQTIPALRNLKWIGDYLAKSHYNATSYSVIVRIPSPPTLLRGLREKADGVSATTHPMIMTCSPHLCFEARPL